MMKRTVEVELRELLFAAFPDDARGRDCLSLCCGFNGEAPLPRTQAAPYLGVKYSLNDSLPFTRERVRQLLVTYEATVTQYVKTEAFDLSALEHAANIVSSIAPATPARVSAALKTAGVVKSDEFSVEAILTLSELLLVPLNVKLTKYNGVKFLEPRSQLFAVLPDTSPEATHEIGNALLRVATKMTVRNGASSATDIASMLIVDPKIPVDSKAYAEIKDNHVAFVRDLVSTGKACVWLDSDQEWFFFNRPCRNRVVTKLQQLFAVVDQKLPVEQLSGRISRCFRDHNPLDRVLPTETLVALAEIVAQCKVVTQNGERFVISKAQETLKSSLPRDLEYLVQFLRENPMSREADIKQHVTENNIMSVPTATQNMYYAPMIDKKSSRYFIAGTGAGDIVDEPAKGSARKGN